ncbi:hypothetical protein GIB67_026334 [Kingdonia uniflora]|uniref:RRM domain-containing protein n=1 Tax=Kingdonia uniflora TaxID=39325 RepID=A0A7J7N111_9MAGN|nr:hypothetical protein GIB67_026334 [Kingdonia uniflora]
MTNSAFPSSHFDYGRSMAHISYPYATILALWVFMDHMLLSLTRSLTRGGGAGINEGYSKGRSGRGYSRPRGDSGGDYGGNRGREEIRGYGQAPPSVAASYGSGAEGNYQPLSNSYGSNNNFVSGVVPYPTRYTGGPNFYPPSYGGPPSYSGDGGSSNMKGSGERGQHDGGYGGAQNIGGGYGGTPPSESPVKVKQCDESCGDSCDNSRIYISNLPPDVNSDELKELFGSIGQSIKIYSDDSGKCKGDAILSYEDPSAAHSAGGFYNNMYHDLRGYKINVAMTEKSAPRYPSSFGHGFYEWNVFHPLEKLQKRLKRLRTFFIFQLWQVISGFSSCCGDLWGAELEAHSPVITVRIAA